MCTKCINGYNAVNCNGVCEDDGQCYKCSENTYYDTYMEKEEYLYIDRCHPRCIVQGDVPHSEILLWEKEILVELFVQMLV